MTDKILRILRHIEDVKNNCEIIAQNLFLAKKESLALDLIANSLIHDNSKFRGIEFLYLNAETYNSDREKFEIAQIQHWNNNKHHPEYWLSFSIKEMPQVFIAEMVADCAARSAESGTNISEWFKDYFIEKYSLSIKDKFYKDIKYYLGLLYKDRI